MAEPAAKRMTLDEFLAWDDGTDTRYELWGGIVTAMAPPMPLHGRLVSRLITALSNALRGRAPCDVYSEAGVVRPDRNDTFYVADIAVSCETLSANDRLLRGPILIVEVLSPSTSSSDRQLKLADYRNIPSVREILLGRDATLALNSVPATISMSELYNGIPLPEKVDPSVGMR